MSRTVLLLGRRGFVLEEVKQQLDLNQIHLLTATTIEDLRQIMANEEVDHVIMGAGLGLDLRCEMVKEIFMASDSTTVHMKDMASGPEGMLPFVSAVLSGVVD